MLELPLTAVSALALDFEVGSAVGAVLGSGRKKKTEAYDLKEQNDVQRKLSHQRICACWGPGCNNRRARRGAGHQSYPQNDVPDDGGDDAENDGPSRSKWLHSIRDMTANDGRLR